MALIADNIVVFLFRVLMREFFRARARSWRRMDATIRSAQSGEHTMYPYTEISYTYKVKFERYKGTYKRGFWYSDSAQDFARAFVPSESLMIRVDPSSPHKSQVFEEDQSWYVGWTGPSSR
jgi:Protein of unknown function (DUF3592)